MTLTTTPPSRHQQGSGQCSRKRMQQNKTKNVKSYGFWIQILKKNVKNVKNVKVITCEVLETTQSVFIL